MRQISIAMLFALGVGFLPVAFAVAPRAPNPVAIVVSPWAPQGEATRVAASADGAILAVSRNGRVAVAQSGTDDFVSRLYQAGALLVLDAEIVRTCFSLNRGDTASSARDPT